MANPEHLKILKQGVEQWNRWRDEHVDIMPDLNEADLTGAPLTMANLEHANLCQAKLDEADLYASDLSRADLSGTTLREANLAYAQLDGANLSGADLYEASLIEAYLCGADFRWASLSDSSLRESNLVGANLIGADLRGANLNGANLAESTVGHTVLGDLDLSGAHGLDRVNHSGPSTMGIDTIYKSQGRIPQVFLRGCGIPDSFIAFSQTLAENPPHFYSCFISYSSKDQEFAERLHADMQAKGVRCWFAPEDLKIGDKFQDRIEESIRYHDKLLLVLSENSIQSPWVEREVQAAFEREQKSNKLVLFPIRLDEAVTETPKAWAADIRRTRHIGEFNRWRDHDSYKRALERLLRDLRAESPAQPESRRDEKS